MIVEFNHDLGRAIDANPEGFIDAIREMIRAGVNDTPSQNKDALRCFGVITSPTHHHSDKAEVVLGTKGGREYWRQSF